MLLLLLLIIILTASKYGCANASSQVIRFCGLNVSIFSNRSNATHVLLVLFNIIHTHAHT